MYSQDDNGRDETNTETSNDTTGSHDTNTSRSSLEDTTDGEDTAANDDGETTANEVGNVTSDDGSEEGTSRENRGYERGRARGNDEAGGVCFQLIARETSVLGVSLAGVLLDEVGHGKDATHPTSVISEEDTTKGREGDDEVGPDGDGRLDAIDIARPTDGNNSSTRHGCDCFLLGRERMKKRKMARRAHVAKVEQRELERPWTNKRQEQSLYLLIQWLEGRDTAAPWLLDHGYCDIVSNVLACFGCISVPRLSRRIQTHPHKGSSTFFPGGWASPPGMESRSNLPGLTCVHAA